MPYLLQKTRVEDLKFGMYVSRLDRPWVETDFMFQGFYIKKLEDIERLQEYCDFVYVDPERGVPVPRDKEIKEQVAEDRLARIFKHPAGDERYPLVTSVEEEFKAARASYDNTLDLVETIMRDIRASRKIKAKAA